MGHGDYYQARRKTGWLIFFFFFVLPNKMEAFDLWTASICLEQVETQIHVCYYELSVLPG